MIGAFTAALTAAVALLLHGALASTALEIHFIDVGQGDAVLIRTPDGRAIMYDGGPDETTALEYLQQVHVTELSLVIASHAHADHIGGLPAIINTFRPPYILDNAIPHATFTYERLIRSVIEAGSVLLEPGERRISLGDVTVHVLPTPGVEAWGQNDNSIGIIIEYGEFRASLMGDAEELLQTWWLDVSPDTLEPVHVHKASHHGSSNGDTEAMMRQLRPQTVVVSVGEANPYGHPVDATIAMYAAAGADIFRTDQHGTVIIRAQPDGSYSIEAGTSSSWP